MIRLSNSFIASIAMCVIFWLLVVSRVLFQDQSHSVVTRTTQEEHNLESQVAKLRKQVEAASSTSESATQLLEIQKLNEEVVMLRQQVAQNAAQHKEVRMLHDQVAQNKGVKLQVPVPCPVAGSAVIQKLNGPLLPESRMTFGSTGHSIGVCPFIKWSGTNPMYAGGASKSTGSGLERCVEKLTQEFRDGKAVYYLQGGAAIAAMRGGSWTVSNDQDVDIFYYSQNSWTWPSNMPCSIGQEGGGFFNPNDQSDTKFLTDNACLCQYSGIIAICSQETEQAVHTLYGAGWWLSLPNGKHWHTIPQVAKSGGGKNIDLKVDPLLSELSRFTSNEKMLLSSFLVEVAKEVNRDWFNNMVRTDPCGILNVFSIFENIYHWLPQYKSLSQSGAAENVKFWPNRKKVQPHWRLPRGFANKNECNMRLIANMPAEQGFQHLGLHIGPNVTENRMLKSQEGLAPGGKGNAFFESKRAEGWAWVVEHTLNEYGKP